MYILYTIAFFFSGILLMEFKVVGVHGGVLQRAFDNWAVKVLVEDV